MGRPSIDLELLLRILLIGYLYGISSERKLVEELRMHLAWRWFTGLRFDEELPHHSTFRRTATAVSTNQSCPSSYSKKLWRDAWQLDWYVETSCRSMELS
jgi:hypothetical protein